MGRVGRMLVVGILSIILVDVSKGGIVVTCVVGMLVFTTTFLYRDIMVVMEGEGMASSMIGGG